MGKLSRPAELAAFGVCALVAVAFLVPAVREVAISYGVTDRPRPGKLHTAPTPYLGGVAIVLIEQDVHRALAISHRAYVLVTGRVAFSGSAEAIARDERIRGAYLGVRETAIRDGDAEASGWLA